MRIDMRQIWITALAASLSTTGFAQATTTTKVDLALAKRYAVEHNYGITALRHSVDEVSARRNRADSAFLPRFGIAGGGESDANPETSESRGVGYAYGTLNIFNGFRDRYRAQVEDMEVEKARSRLQAEEFVVGLEVEKTFHEYLYKKALIELKDAALARNEDHQRLVKQSRAIGGASETDVMEFQMKDATLRSELVALKQELDDARSNLKLLLGEEIGGNVVPVGDLQHQHVEGSLMDYLSLVESETEAVRTAARDVSIARTEREIASGRWLPEVDLEARLGYLPSPDQIDDKRPQASIALVAKLELYSGGDVVAEERERGAASARAEAELRNVINQTLRQVEIGYRNLKVLEARSDLERDNVRFAQRFYSSVTEEYKRGFKNSSDLSSAADRLGDAEARRVELDYQFLLRRLEVERALGAPMRVGLASAEKGDRK